GGPHVLNADHGIGIHDLQACLEEQLLRERVTDLHGGPLLFRCLIEVRGGHGGAVDPVASRLRADVDDRIADAAGGTGEDAVTGRYAEGKDVDEDVAVVGTVKRRLSADGRDADAVAVAADAANDTVDEVLH